MQTADCKLIASLADISHPIISRNFAMESTFYRMLKPVHPCGFVKPICLTIFFFFIHIFIFSQTILLKGIIKDERTLRPIQEVNIKVNGTTKGTATDKTGSFSLRLNKTPATLVITCIGYEDA